MTEMWLVYGRAGDDKEEDGTDRDGDEGGDLPPACEDAGGKAVEMASGME